MAIGQSGWFRQGRTTGEAWLAAREFRRPASESWQEREYRVELQSIAEQRARASAAGLPVVVSAREQHNGGGGVPYDAGGKVWNTGAPNMGLLDILSIKTPGAGSLGGDLLGVFGGWVAGKAQAKAASQNAKAARKMVAANRGRYGGWPAGSWESDTYGEPGTFPAGGSVSAAPYVDLPYRDGMTNAAYMGGGAALTAARGVATVATPYIKRIVAWLVSNGLPVAAAGSAVAGLIAGGVIDARGGPYENPKHNKVSGIMRGDVIALRRVKRSAKRLQKVLRMAGAGRRSLRAGCAPRRRRC